MIPPIPVLRRDAKVAWSDTPHGEKNLLTAMSGREVLFRRQFIDELWVPQINEARRRGELSDEELRLAFDAIYSPIPSRRRFNVTVRMSVEEARAELIDCGEDIAGMTNDDLTVTALDFGIIVELDDDDPAA